MTTAVTTSLEQWYSLQAKTQEARVVQIFDLLRQNGIEPILIKGWAASRWYPSSARRRPGDIDLAIAPNDFGKACKVIEASKPNYLVDLHCGLRTLDRVPWEDLFANSTSVAVNDAEIRVLRPEDHLRVLCTHWLLDGGGYKDKLWDIYYAIDRRPADFDWHRCLDVVPSHRRGWIVCAIALAHQYLGLPVKNLPIESEINRLPKWIARRVEKEWRYPEHLEPVLTMTHSKKLMLRQIVRRIPPNPIRATVEGEGDLFGPWRWWYQAAVLGRRAVPFARDCVSVLRRTMVSRSE